MSLPEAEKTQIACKANANAFIVPVAQLFALNMVAFILGTVQLPAVLYLSNKWAIYAIAAGFIVAAILSARAFGMWQASWSVRVLAALISVIVTSWPVLALLFFAVCHSGTCWFS